MGLVPLGQEGRPLAWFLLVLLLLALASGGSLAYEEMMDAKLEAKGAGVLRAPRLLYITRPSELGCCANAEAEAQEQLNKKHIELALEKEALVPPHASFR